MTALKAEQDSTLHSLPFFSGLPAEDIDAIINAGRVRNYDKNQTLFMHGDPAKTFFILIKGYVKIHSETVEGDESVIAVLTEGDTVGEASIFDGAIYPFSACATKPSEIFEVNADFLRTRAKESPALSARIMSVMSHKLHDLQVEKEHFSVMSASQRVGCTLLKLSANMIDCKGGTFTLPYEKSLIAANLSMKPETLSRALKELQGYGVTIQGSEVTIESFERLAGFCCVHCSVEGGCR